jgi:hypothetical protein
MPKIPLQSLPTVSPEQGPTPQFSLDSRGAFGEAVGNAGQEVAQTIGKVAVVAKQRADLAAVEDAETEFEKTVQSQLYGAPNSANGSTTPLNYQPDARTQGFLQTQGHDALERSADVIAQLGKARDQIMGNLTDDGQRAAFKRRTDGSILMAQQHVEQHVATQSQVVEGQSFEARRAVALDSIANGYNLPGVVARERQNLEPAVMLEAKRRGLEGATTYPPAEGTPAAVFLDSWRRDVAKTVLDRMLSDKDTTKARAFMAQPLVAGGPSVSDTLGQEADRYVAKIQAVGEMDDAYNAAQGIVDGLKDPETGKVDEVAARAKVAELPPSKRRETRSVLESILGHERESWKKQVDDAWDKAKTAYLAGPGGRAALQRIDGGLAGWLVVNAPDTWRQLQNWADQDDRERDNAKPTPSQEAAFSSIATSIVDDPSKFVGLSGSQFEQQFLSQIAPRDRRALLGHFLQAKGVAQKPDETLPPSVMAEIVEEGRKAGVFPKKKVDPKTWKPEQAAAHAQMIRDLLQFQTEQKRKGTPIDPKTWTDQIHQRLKTGTVVGGGSWWGDAGGVTELEARTSDAYAGKPFQEDIPDAFAKEAMAALSADRAAWIPPTQENVRYLWEKKKWIEGGKQGNPPARPATMKPEDRSKSAGDDVLNDPWGLTQ